MAYRRSSALGSIQRGYRRSGKQRLRQRLTGYEIAFKQRLGRLPIFPERLLARVRRERIATLPMSLEHAVAAASLPGLHRDPWDRIMAQAVVEECHMVTIDGVFSDYGIPVLW